MKLSIILISMTMTMTSFVVNPAVRGEGITSSTQLAEQIVTALKKASPEMYIGLFPTLGEFHKLMEQNAVVYGRFLPEAQREFNDIYDKELLPKVRASFASIIEEGKAKGIDWNNIEFVGLEKEIAKGFLPSVPVTILLKSKGIEFRIEVEKVLIIDNQYRVSQYIRFV